MNRGLPGADLLAVIAPHYPKVPGAGRRPIGGERMLRIYFLQQWFALSDPRVEESQYDSRAMREWGGIDLGGEGAPDESLSATCWHASRHRHPCRCHDYPCVGLDQECKEAARPREASNQKSGQWYLGRKALIGVECPSKRIHSGVATVANGHDSQGLASLLHGNEQRVYGDSADGGGKASPAKGRVLSIIEN